jgi:aminoglycoside 3-N-acetyltransferase
MTPSTRTSLVRDLSQLGVRPGDLIMFHSSLRAIGPVVGGAETIIRSLLDAVGPTGTLAAYLDFEPYWEEGDPEIPVFDKRTAPAARDHGALHEVFRTWPGTLRSDHPDAGVGALGPRAEWITASHPLQYGYGPGTPFERIVECGGRILMLGAPLDTVTLVHYAEHLARLPGKRLMRYRRLMPGPTGPEWIDFEEFDTTEPPLDVLPENEIEVIARAYLTSGQGRQGKVGQSESYLFEAPGLVEFAIAWLERFVAES